MPDEKPPKTPPSSFDDDAIPTSDLNDASTQPPPAGECAGGQIGAYKLLESACWMHRTAEDSKRLSNLR